MNKKAQWILTEEEIKQFENERENHYKLFQYQTGKDVIFNQGTIAKFVHFMRRRRRQNQYPFKFEKIIHYAVALYKRYYLVNSFICEDVNINQAIICCIYLSLKYNEYDDNFMRKAADKWKTHKYFYTPGKDPLPHYGDIGYSNVELKFLSGIKFQTGLSKVISPLEALFHTVTKGPNAIQQISSNTESLDDKYRIIGQIQKYLNKLYEHPTVMFLFEGPKIALSIMVAILRSKKLKQSLLGPQMEKIVESCEEQIKNIITSLDSEEDEKGMFEEESKRINKIQGFKKPLQKTHQSPRFQPQRHDHIFDEQ